MEARHTEETLIVSIRDNGKGIADYNFDRALGQFRQIGPSAGSGLGQPIDAAVAEGLGGKVKPSNKDRESPAVLRCPF